VRYFTLSAPPRGNPGAPSDATTATGLLPVAAGASPKATKWGFWGATPQLEGQPGTQAVAAPNPKVSAAASPRTSPVGGIFYSDCAPDYIYPSLYYVRGYQEHSPVSLQRTNNMPVPAVDFFAGSLPGSMHVIKPTQERGGTQQTRLAQMAARSWKVGGKKALRWPSAPQNWHDQ
jgi:hypothetical protein